MVGDGNIALVAPTPLDAAPTEGSGRPPVAATVYTPQILRGVACLLVAVYHGAGLVDHHYGVDPLRGLSRFGFSGVHMFFVISGLIIYHAHRRDLGDASRAPRYLIKRLVRIYPFYWIAFLALGGRKVFSGRLAIGDFLTNALFFSASESLVIAVAWTLAYEMIFYGIFLAFFVKRALGIAVFATWFVLVALNHHHRFAGSIGLELLNVLFGLGLLTSVAVIALRRRWDARRRDQLGAAALVAGIVVFLGTACYCPAQPHEGMGIWRSLPLTLGFGIGSALLLFASVSGRIEAFLERRRLMLLIGDASYSIYLLHFYFEKRTSNAIRSLGWVPEGETTQLTALVVLAAILVAAVAGGILVHKWIEKPLLIGLRKWLRVGQSVR